MLWIRIRLDSIINWHPNPDSDLRNLALQIHGSESERYIYGITTAACRIMTHAT
jgi:hypothetical protein